uniref:F-box domain-containing protein n=1 Tax=Parascaris univalens TaxID=6257 RepID=A0A914ZXI2_PARUN
AKAAMMIHIMFIAHIDMHLLNRSVDGMWGGSSCTNWVIDRALPATRFGSNMPNNTTRVPQLPNELIVEIWKKACAQDRRNCRAVCRHWKALYHRCKFPRTRFLNLNISIRDGQYVLFGRKEGKTSCAIEIRPQWRFLASAFQMVELVLGTHLDKIEKRGGLLSIEGRALTDELLLLILEQKWNIRSVELNGETVFVRNEAMCEFVSKQNQDNGLSNIECLVLRDAVINVGFISDRLLSSFNSKLYELHVHLTHNCKQWLSRTSLSNFSLPLMIKPNSTFFIPSPLANRITMTALKMAIEEYFKTDWNKTDVPSSLWRNEQGRLSTYPGYYSCTLTLHLNTSVNAQAVAQVEMPGVEKVYFAIGAGTFYQKTVEKEEMGLRGRVLFVKRNVEGCTVARIAVS